VDCVDRCMGMDRWMFGSGDAMDYCCAGNADLSCKGLWEIRVLVSLVLLVLSLVNGTRSVYLCQ
jgi:hypothetical protein